MEQLSTLNISGPIDYDNLNIITHPRPPRRRQSGISLVPFRPYVKSLTSVRGPSAYADGTDKWTTAGKNEVFFKQENARCIGTLIDDCHVSDVIRWDIEGESTRLPMVCKLWMIVDGAVVERGKPRLVQDAAVQVFTAGRNRRTILAAEQRYNQTSISTLDRRRRQSWHDVNEYHSVPYYQYSRSVRSGYHEGIQCDLDNEQPMKIEFNLRKKQTASETVHNQSTPRDRVQTSITTQTEHRFVDQTTEIESDLLVLYNLNLQTNENLLSSIVNPYNQIDLSDYIWENSKFVRNGIEYSNKSTSTGDDYPQWWAQLSTNVLLSNYITNQGEKKKQSSPISTPRQQLDQSIQTEIEQNFDNENEKPRPQSASTRSSRILDNYEIIDQTNDGNNSRRLFPLQDSVQQIDSDSHLSDFQIETTSTRRLRRITTSSKLSDSDYHTMQQSNSTPDDFTNTQRTSMYSSTNEIDQRKRTKSSESTSTLALTTLLERYERTLKERQQAIATVNNQPLDIDEVLKRYRTKVENPEKANQLCEDISLLATQSKEANSLSLPRMTKDKYRTMPGVTSEEMLQGYTQSPRLYITDPPNNNISNQRQTRLDYYDLSVTDNNTNSAWIRYNEQRIDQLQQRLDLLLQIDDNEESQLIFSTDTVTQRIDDLIMKKFKGRNSTIPYHKRIFLPRRYSFRLPYRSNTSQPNSPRLLTRNLIRSTKSTPKTVRISTIPDQIRLREPSKPIPQPAVSILRRTASISTPRPRRSSETNHIWKDDSDGKVYILKQFSIPRYYRLYNDVSFRQIYNFTRILDTYVNRATPENYSSIIKNFAIQQLLPTLTSIA